MDETRARQFADSLFIQTVAGAIPTTTEHIQKYTAWTIASLGGVFAVLVSQIDKLTPQYLDMRSFKVSLALFVIAATMHVIERSVAMWLLGVASAFASMREALERKASKEGVPADFEKALRFFQSEMLRSMVPPQSWIAGLIAADSEKDPTRLFRRLLSLHQCLFNWSVVETAFAWGTIVALVCAVKL
jgi:hypothetical protein